MARLINSILCVVVCQVFQPGAAAAAYENEVGNNKLFVANPKRAPLASYSSDDLDFKVWDCDGLVHEVVLKYAFRFLSAMAGLNKLTAPDERTCTFLQTTLRWQGKTRITHTVEYYVSPDARRPCITKVCGNNSRVATFFPKETDLQMSLMVTDSMGKGMKAACGSLLARNFIDGNRGCSN